MSAIDIAVAMAEDLDSQFEELAAATVKLPVINTVVLDYLANGEAADVQAMALIKEYLALHKKYVALKVSDENVVAANVWAGTKGAKIRANIIAGVAYLKSQANMVSEIAGNETVSNVIARAEKLGNVPNSAADKGTKPASLDDRVRAWAKSQNWPIGSRGAVSAAYKKAYADAGLA